MDGGQILDLQRVIYFSACLDSVLIDVCYFMNMNYVPDEKLNTRSKKTNERF